jgi:hypothetical protein
MQLHPREKYTITRQLANPYITDTFYVRAVIRNAKTDAIIDTLDLDDNTNQRFTKQWLVPADPSGQGFYISIVTSVYTDSGYTTKSELYGDEQYTFLVQERYVFNPNYPVGQDIDYKRIKKMIDEAVKAVADKKQNIVSKNQPIIVEKIKEVDLSGVLKAIEVVGKKIDDKPVTKVPPQKEVDLTPVVSQISKVIKETSSALGKKIDTLKVKVEIKGNVMDERSESNETPMDSRISRLMKTI